MQFRSQLVSQWRYYNFQEKSQKYNSTFKENCGQCIGLNNRPSLALQLGFESRICYVWVDDVIALFLAAKVVLYILMFFSLHKNHYGHYCQNPNEKAPTTHFFSRPLNFVKFSYTTSRT